MDELDKGNISAAAAGKEDISWMAELGCATLPFSVSLSRGEIEIEVYLNSDIMHTQTSSI